MSSYEIPGMFQVPFEDLSRLQLGTTRPGFDVAGEAGGLSLGPNVSFMNVVAESRGLASPHERTRRAPIKGVVSDPQDVLGGPWDIGGEGFPTTNSPDSALEGVVVASHGTGPVDPTLFEHGKDGKMTKKGRQDYVHALQKVAGGYDTVSEAGVTEGSKNRAKGRGDGGDGRAQGNVNGVHDRQRGPIVDGDDLRSGRWRKR